VDAKELVEEWAFEDGGCDCRHRCGVLGRASLLARTGNTLVLADSVGHRLHDLRVSTDRARLRLAGFQKMEWRPPSRRSWQPSALRWRTTSLPEAALLNVTARKFRDPTDRIDGDEIITEEFTNGFDVACDLRISPLLIEPLGSTTWCRV